MLAARPDAQLALTNGGGLRATLPAGELTYGQLFQSIPFDNRFALVDLDGKSVRKLVARNLGRGGGIFSWGGLTAVAACKGDKLDVQIKVAGKSIDDKKRYRLVTSDFLATGGDGALGWLKLPASAITPTDIIIRDAMADVLRARHATIDPRELLGDHKRLSYPGQRPVKCGNGGGDDDHD
jgi:5'-nucleotidase